MDYSQSQDKGKQTCKMFLGGLHLDTSEEELREFYGEFGTIVDCVVMRDGATKKSRGFGFVTYEEPESVDNALQAKPHVITGREVDSKRAVPKDDVNPLAHVKTKRVFIGGLGPGIEENELKEYFERDFGEVSSVEIPRDKETNQGRGFAFVNLEDFDKVDKACIQRYHEICGRKCEVKKAETKEAIRIRDAQEKGYGGGRDNRSRGGPPGGMYGGMDSPYSSYKNYYGRGYPMGYSPFMPANPYGASMYDNHGGYRDSYSRGGGQRGYGGSSGYYDNPGGPGGYYGGGMDRGSYFGAGYSQLPSSFGPSRDYTMGTGGRDRDHGDARKGGSSVSGSRGYHPYHH